MQTQHSIEKPPEVRSEYSLMLPAASAGLTVLVIAILLSGFGRSRPR